MSNQRKRRKDAVKYEFDLYGCKDYFIKVAGKTYVYESVVVREAKKVFGNKYTQPIYSLYRDLQRTASAKDIYGLRAVCLEDFNSEGHLCSIRMFEEEGHSVMMFEEEL